MGKLEGRVALVTGGLSGIGRATAELFASEGATVSVFDAREESRDDGLPAAELIGRLGGVFVHGDVREPADVERAVAEVVERHGGLHVLVNFAGINMFKPLPELTVADYDLAMAINARGTFLFCKHAIERMREQEERGVIVNVASNFAFVAEPEATAYCASKGAVASMSKALALEVGPLGIRVNALCPGATATELNREHRSRPEVAAEWKRKTPLDLRRDQFLAYPHEIARAALFLASDDSLYMTGSNLIIDGGWNAQ